jgi:hypothetical protein
LIAVEFVHGILRAIFLVPVVGDFRARRIGVFIGSGLILLVACIFRPLAQRPESEVAVPGRPALDLTDRCIRVRTPME